MLLKLNGMAQLSAAVQLISLKTSRVATGSRCLTAGWGDIGDDGTKPNTLQEVNVTTLSRRTCRRRWGSVPISRSMVCSEGAKAFQGPCRGDSGGPLVCDGAAAGVSPSLAGDAETPRPLMSTQVYPPSGTGLGKC
ncbi:serine protease ami-like [Hippoglossus stenolepis]|uniref:serine protease ami-like n=1 Tax=Hippoglossus stenolepis TaxID=195615 RepID=UPI001FAE96BA|nr:serine protease ami-like [Hippoglossus stenolepis]